MKALQLKVKILSQARIKDHYWHCEVRASRIAQYALPGQFINIRVSNLCEPLLRRPISIHGASGSKIKIFYEVVGKATEILAQKKKGELLDVIGPLGNGFDFRGQGTGDRGHILIAGGMGVAPLMFLAEKLAKSIIHHPSSIIQVLIGAKTQKDLLCVQDFKKLGCDVKIATDDGSSGFKGRVSDLLKYLLRTTDYGLRTIYACGPRPMLKTVADMANEREIPAQLSLEEHMSCAIGACLGCVVKTKEGFKRVCQEGPVFNAQEIIWE